MQSTLSIRSIGEDELNAYLQGSSSSSNQATAHSAVALPSFSRQHKSADKSGHQPRLRSVHAVQPSVVHPQAKPGTPARPRLVPNLVPDMVPGTTPETKGRRVPILVRTNRALRTVLVALCGIVILGYGLDVAASNQVGKLQDQARRLNEQNSELSANLLKSISYRQIQQSSLAGHNLQTAQHVVVVAQQPAPKVAPFKPTRQGLPVFSGY